MHVPQYTEKRIDPFTGDDQVYTMGSKIGLYSTFSRNLDRLWMLWELMMSGEPILVMGETPSVCGDVTWALMELIKPVRF